jgi:hypothetical protein
MDEARTPESGETGKVTPLRRSLGMADTPELVRAAEAANRDSARRVAEDESSRCLPRLRSALLDVERGVQLLEMARFGGADQTSQALAEALGQLAGAAEG